MMSPRHPTHDVTAHSLGPRGGLQWSRPGDDVTQAPPLTRGDDDDKAASAIAVRHLAKP